MGNNVLDKPRQCHRLTVLYWVSQYTIQQWDIYSVQTNPVSSNNPMIHLGWVCIHLVYLGMYLVSSKRPMIHLGMLSVKNVMTMIDIILVRCISFLSVPWWCSGGGDDNGDDDDDVDCENKKFTNLSSETATETAGIGPSWKVSESTSIINH